jgi:hypothetical protein
MASTETTNSSSVNTGKNEPKKKIIINAFDMSTIGHLSPGQWKVSTSGAAHTTQNLNSTEPSRQVSNQA